MSNKKKGNDNLVVKYKNEFNTVPLRNFKPIEMDLLFAICSKVKNKGLEEIVFTFEQLKELSKYNAKDNDRFIKDLESTYNKLIGLNYRIETDKEIIRFVLFTKYSISKTKDIVAIQTNKEFEYILNDFVAPFTQFELIEFTQLKSSYSKTMYRLLKQFRTTGFYRVSIEEFRHLLDIPECYSMSDIDKRVLKYITKELTPYFEDLKLTKLRGTGKRKRYVDALRFDFKKEHSSGEYDPNKYSKKESEQSSNQNYKSKSNKSYKSKTNKFHNFESGNKFTEKELEEIAEKNLAAKLQNYDIPDYFEEDTESK